MEEPGLIKGFIDDYGFQLLAIVIGAYLIRKFSMVIVSRVVHKAIRPDKYSSLAAEKQREDTLIAIIDAGIRFGIWLVTAMLILSALGIDIAPLLAGAGVIGLAVGFGAQSLVKDFFAGIFIIIENQYRVGDIIQINQGVAGIVEEVSLRQTVLRDLDGMVHYIPNGMINIATNMTMEFANINLDIGVDYKTDIDKAKKIINQVGLELAGDEHWKSRITEPPAFLRINEFADSAIVIKIMGKTVPMEQWAATGELRERLKKAFDKAGISIPFPQRVIHQAKTNNNQ